MNSTTAASNWTLLVTALHLQITSCTFNWSDLSCHWQNASPRAIQYSMLCLKEDALFKRGADASVFKWDQVESRLSTVTRSQSPTQIVSKTGSYYRISFWRWLAGNVLASCAMLTANRSIINIHRLDVTWGHLVSDFCSKRTFFVCSLES